MKVIVTLCFLFCFVCAYAQKPVNEVALTRSHIVLIDYNLQIFKVINKSNYSLPAAYYDKDLNLLKEIPAHFSIQPNISSNIHSAFKEEEEMFDLSDDSTYRVFSTRGFMEVANYRPKRKENELKIYDGPYQNTILKRTHPIITFGGEKYNPVNIFLGLLPKHVCPENNFRRECFVYKVDGGGNKAYCTATDIDLVERKVVSTIEFPEVGMEDKYFINARLYGLYTGNNISGFYSIHFFSNTKLLESSSLVTVVLTSYNLGGEIRDQSFLPLSYLFRENVPFFSTATFFEKNVEFVDEHTFFVNTKGDTYLFLDEAFNEKLSFKFGDDLSDLDMPDTYKYFYKKRAIWIANNPKYANPHPNPHPYTAPKIYSLFGNMYVMAQFGAENYWAVF